jgi:hypothetical protein
MAPTSRGFESGRWNADVIAALGDGGDRERHADEEDVHQVPRALDGGCEQDRRDDHHRDHDHGDTEDAGRSRSPFRSP